MAEHENGDEISQSEKEKDTLTRRGLIRKAMEVSIGARLSSFPSISQEAPVLSTETHEGLIPSELSYVVLKIPKDRVGEVHSPEGVRYFLDTIESALTSHPSDLVLTPEFSFTVRDEYTQLRQVSDDEWIVDEASPPITKEMIGKLQQLATDHHTHIMAATINEITQDGIEHESTLLHINTEGKIVGMKRKNLADQVFPPEGNWTIEKDDHAHKVLPVICGDRSFPSEDGSEVTGHTIIHQWIKQSVLDNGPFDILLHPQLQGDAYFEILAAQAEGTITEEQEKGLKSSQETFDYYYKDYLPYLSANGVILTTDMGTAAILRKDNQGFLNYTSDSSLVTVSGETQ